MKIPNLYRPEAQDILMFKELWSLEKIHGTSANLSYSSGCVKFFSGGATYSEFIKLFNAEELKKKFDELGLAEKKTVIYGEAYAGKMQAMKETYGPNLSFIAFEVNIDDKWLSVPDAANIVEKLGLEFVPYIKINANLKEIDEQRDADSIVAIRRGMGAGKMREGVVLRPLIELTKNNGSRFIVKHKRDEFKETKTPRSVDTNKLELFNGAEEVANEFVTSMRLKHVLDKMQGVSIEKTGAVIKAMIDDIYLECSGEFEDNEFIKKAMGKKVALLFKEYLKST